MIFCIIDITQLLKKEPNLTDLLILLADIEYEWHNIGVALEVEQNVLESCYRSNENNSYKLFKVINSWMTSMTSEVTWEAVIAAVESRIVKHKSTAVKMRTFLAKPEVRYKYEEMSDVNQISDHEVRPKREHMTAVVQTSRQEERPQSTHTSDVDETSAPTKKKCQIL